MSDQHNLFDPSPREVFELFMKATAENDFDELADLYSPDVIIEIPFAPPGVPQRREGREVIREGFKSVSGMRRFNKVELLAMHETLDPEVIIVEWEAHGQVTTTGKLFKNSYIMVVRVRNGQIVNSRDYSNPIEGANAFDRLPELFEALMKHE